jgi:hypothetical protein
MKNHLKMFASILLLLHNNGISIQMYKIIYPPLEPYFQLKFKIDKILGDLHKFTFSTFLAVFGQKRLFFSHFWSKSSSF